MDNIITFTLGSGRDAKSRVTVTPNRIFNKFSSKFTYNQFVDRAEKITVTIKSNGKNFEVLFYRNRVGSSGTFKTTSWPNDLPLPEIGNSINLEVLNVDIINNTQGESNV